MQKMSVDDFARLPYADRLAYAVETYGSAFPLDTPTSTIDATIIPGLFWQYAYGTAFNSPDPDERAKLAGASSYYSLDVHGDVLSSYQETADQAVRLGGEGIGASNAFVYVASGQLQQGTDFYGTPIDFVNVTYYLDSPANTQTAQAIRTEVKLLDDRTVVYYAMGWSTQGQGAPDTDYPY